MGRAPGLAMLAFAAAAAAAACAAGAAGADHTHGPQAGGGGLPSKAVENSVPYVGGGTSTVGGGGGRGITVAVIDTGVDSFHPDFAGGGAAGGSRVVGSRNLLGAGPAFDADGHGTGVAGVIAAGGALRGMAPLSEIVSYKVSGDGLSVSPDLIIRAVRGAVADGADVVNISLGVNRTNEDIDAEVNRAVASGVVVVAAAGNDGPGAGTIGSPGRNPNVITVGATYNNVTAGLVAAVEHGGSTYGAVPMVGAPEPEEPVAGRIVFAGHATAADMARAGEEAAGSIVLAERGGGGEGGALVYFSDKERNAAAAGAAALVVYNDEPGMFFGELVHEHNPGGYAPSIPTVSMSREDGLELRAAAEEGGEEGAVLEVRKSPDFVAGFSSRGPVSPFYPKPDLVAPGVFVNTTLNGGGYNVSSGTSFAAPHVAGAAALLLERRPGLEPAAVKSILVTTADAVAGAEGPPRVMSGADAAGAGRLNVTRALAADIVFDPPLLDLDVSPARPSGSASIGVARLGGGEVGPLGVSATLPRGLSGSHSVEYDGRGGATVTLEASLGGEEGEDAAGGQGARTLAGSLAVSGGGASYAVPVMVRVSNGSIAAAEVPGGGSGWGGWIGLENGGTGGAVEVSVESPDGWSYARVTVTDPRSGAQYHGSSRPGEPALVEVGRNGTHWIEASILVGGRPGGPVAEAFGKVDVEGAAAGRPAGVIPDSAAAPWPRLPEGQAAIVAAAAVAVASAGAAAAALARRQEAPPPPPPPPLQRVPPPPPPPDRAFAGERPSEDRAGARP